MHIDSVFFASIAGCLGGMIAFASAKIVEKRTGNKKNTFIFISMGIPVGVLVGRFLYAVLSFSA
jgi:surfactin synthase thioesterase subunit